LEGLTPMTKLSSTRSRLPALVINADDHHRLTMLAEAASDRMPDVAEVLLQELDRARVVKDGSAPADRVRMGSTVTYRSDSGERTVRLVYPGEADIEAGRISILTPIGAALIGLSPGQSIKWTARDGVAHQLTIVDVKPPTV